MSTSSHLQHILERALQGDEKAYEELYTLYAVPVYRYIYLRIGQKEDAEDILQEAFIRLYTHIQKIQLDSRGLLPYMYTIARNLSIDHLRKKRPETSADEWEYIADTAPTPEEMAQMLETKSYVEKLLLRLPPDIREIIVLSYITELSNKEISEIVHKSEEAIRQVKSRALRSLRNYIEKNEK